MTDLVKSTENLALQNASQELEHKHQAELEKLEEKRYRSISFALD